MDKLADYRVQQQIPIEQIPAIIEQLRSFRDTNQEQYLLTPDEFNRINSIIDNLWSRAARNRAGRFFTEDIPNFVRGGTREEIAAREAERQRQRVKIGLE